MPNRELLIDLAQWTARPKAQDFPLDAVIAEFRRVGKHFVDRGLLDALAQARAALPCGEAQLRRFLDTALDKYDGRSTTRPIWRFTTFRSRRRRGGVRSTRPVPSASVTA